MARNFSARRPGIENPNQALHERMTFADYTHINRELWGGIKIGFDKHTIRRSKERYYEHMGNDLLAYYTEEIFHSAEILEEYFLELPDGSASVVYDEKSGFVLFVQAGFDEETHLNEMFISTFLIYDPTYMGHIYVNESDRGRYKIDRDNNVIINPPEMKEKR